MSSKCHQNVTKMSNNQMTSKQSKPYYDTKPIFEF